MSKEKSQQKVEEGAIRARFTKELIKMINALEGRK